MNKRRGCLSVGRISGYWALIRHTTGRKNGYLVPVTFSKVHTRIQQVFRAGYLSPVGNTRRYPWVKEASTTFRTTCFNYLGTYYVFDLRHDTGINDG